MPTIPGAASVTTIADGAAIIASDHRNNYSALAASVNGTISALTTGLAGQVPQITGSVVTPTYPPGYEFAYAEFISTVSSTTATEVSPLDVVSAGAVTFDGATSVIVEFFSPGLANGGASNCGLSLWDTTDQGRLFFNNTIVANAPVLARRKVTPTAAAHTFKVRVWTAGGSNVSVLGGAGGAGVNLPGYIRITKA